MVKPVIPLWEPPLKEYDHITQGAKTEEFEKKFAEFVGSQFAVACTSGTVALFMALKVAGVGEGDEVIVPDLTAPATANAVKLTGAKVVLAHVSEKDLLIEPRACRKYWTPKTKAVIPVHLNGRVVDLYQFSPNLQGIDLIEDSCQALGCKRVVAGSFTCYSFSPTKTIYTGQGGMVTTDNRFDYEALVKLKQEAGNFKFTDLQAEVALEYMKQMKTILERKGLVYFHYKTHLRTIQGVQLPDTEFGVNAPWLVDMLVDTYKERETLIAFLAQNGVETRRFYTPLHILYPESIRRDGLWASEWISQRGLYLPSSVHLDREDIMYVVNKIKEFFECESSSREPQAS